MKTAQINDAGYTADGKWRLVLVEPTDSMKDSARTDHAVWCELSKNGLADLLKQKDARIAELTEQLTDAQDKLEKMFASASNIIESAVTLLTQLDELKVKADRYDYLRENCFDTEEKQDGDLLGYVALIFESDLLIPYDSESLDKAIDAARGGV